MSRRRRKKSKKLPIVLSALIILIGAACGGTYWYFNFGPGDTTCVITYDINGKTTSYEYEKGTTVTIPSVENKDGYRFVGFEPAINNDTIAKKDQTYVAKYIKTHEVTIDINGELTYLTVDDGTKISDITKDIEVEAPEHYAFSNWEVNASTNGVVNQDLTIKAVFIKSEVVVAFYNRTTKERLTEDMVVPINHKFETLPFEVPEGYVCEVYSEADSMFTNFNDVPIRADQNFYVIIGEKICNVIFYYGENQNTSFRVPKGYTFDVEKIWQQMNNRTGYTLLGFENKVTKEPIDLNSFVVENSSYLISAKYGPDQCKVSYYVNGTIEKTEFVWINNCPVGYTPSTIPTGYEFAGWSTTETGNAIDITTLTLTDHVSLYAQFKPLTYTITLKDNDGNILATKDLEYGYRIISSVPGEMGVATTKTGYTYINTTLNGEVVSYPYTVTGPVTFVMNWQINSYNVYYYTNGSTNYTSTYSVAKRDVITSGTVLYEPAVQAPELPGYIFKGWALNNTGSVMVDWTNGLSVTTQGWNLYTIYEAIPCIVTFTVKGEIVDTQEVLADNYATSPELNTLVGKEQLSYWTVNGERVDISKYKITSDVNFVAVIITDPLITYTDSNLTVKLNSAEGQTITSGTQIESGNWIYIYLTPDSNYTGNFIKVNGHYVGNGQLYPLTNEDIVIETEYLNTRTEGTGMGTTVIVQKASLTAHTDNELIVTMNNGAIYEETTPHTFTVDSITLNNIATGTTYTSREIRNQKFTGSASYTLTDGTIMFIQIWSTPPVVIGKSIEVHVRVYTSNPEAYTFNYIKLTDVQSNFVA